MNVSDSLSRGSTSRRAAVSPPFNPATPVRGPKHVVKKGKTPVLKPEEARALLDSIDTGTLTRLRDRALIGVMVYSSARVGAVVRMRVEDYYQHGRRSWLRWREKGGKRHEVPAHHNAEEYQYASRPGGASRNHRRGSIHSQVSNR